MLVLKILVDNMLVAKVVVSSGWLVGLVEVVAVKVKIGRWWWRW